jgi:hypothetical protein
MIKLIKLIDIHNLTVWINFFDYSYQLVGKVIKKINSLAESIFLKKLTR